MSRATSDRPLLLAGDIGGTKALLELSVPGDGTYDVLHRAELPSVDHASLEDLVRSFLDQAPRRAVGVACFSVAAPIVGGRGRFTNLPWTLDESVLARTLGLPKAVLLNDFVAACYGVDDVGPKERLTLACGTPDPEAPRLVVGAGTGLGQAFLLPGPCGPRAFPSEGGHSGFAPRGADDHALHRFLLDRYGERVSQERVLSGEGLALLEAFLSGEEPRAPEAVTTGAGAGEPQAVAAVRLFLALYGSYVGDAALEFLPRGGIYVAGGLVTHLRPWLEGGEFLAGFLDKGRMRPIVEGMPLHVVLDPALELLGARRYARESLR